LGKYPGQRWPTKNRSLFNSPPRDRSLAQKISIENGSQARQSTEYLTGRYEKGGHAEKVKLVRAANQAANRAKVISQNPRVSGEQQRQAADASQVYRGWVDARKGKE
jgi:hypothetical protein